MGVIDLSPGTHLQHEFVTDIQFDEMLQLGQIGLTFDNIVEVYPGDTIRTQDEQAMFHVESIEQIEDLFENFTIAHVTVQFGTNSYPVLLNDHFPGPVVVYAGMDRLIERAVFFGEHTNLKTK